MVEEHQISLKTNKGAQHMNLWLKANPSFDNDDTLDDDALQVDDAATDDGKRKE